MQTESVPTLNPITQPDQQELEGVMNGLELSDRTQTIFAIAPEVSPKHPVVEHLVAQLANLEESFQIAPLFHYSDDTLYDYLQRLEVSPSPGRQVVMAFGLEALKFADPARFGREMKQLNLGREEIFKRDLVLIFWLSQADFLDEFRRRAPDFWDWRGSTVRFETRPTFDPIFYPYLEWLIAENSRLKIGGVRQVQRQVDIFLDQIYVSLQGSRVEERSTSERREQVGVQRESSRSSQPSPRAASSTDLEQPDGLEPEPEDWVADFSEDEMTDVATTRRVVTLDLAEAVQKHVHCVILGDPGAGKTTLLRYLARHHALAKRDNQPTARGGAGQESLGEPKLPILFRIAEYAEQLKYQQDRGADLSLEDYLRQFYRRWDSYFEALPGNAVAEWLLEKMGQGVCLLLLDGLDEVFDEASRSLVVEKIEQFVGKYALNRFVVTSRIAGYQAASLGDRFQEFTVREMEITQIEEFLKRWCLAIETTLRPEASAALRKRDADQEAEGIVQAITHQPGVKRFATNPLLLTILAMIQRNGVRLPQRRVELYALATTTLIEDWQFARNIAYNARTEKDQLILAEEDVIALLAPLAFWMHEHKASGLITQAEAEEQLTPRMAELQGVDEATAQTLVQQFLRKVREVTGLFVERAAASYGFMHLTFEEYFVARHIADNEVADILTTIRSYRDQARWNEPILLALGYLSSTNQNRANRLMQQLFGDLEAYQPIAGSEIRLKEQPGSPSVLTWQAESSAGSQPQESASVWKELLFAGQVLAEVKVAASLRKRLIEKLVITYLCLEKSYEDEPVQQLLRLLRGVELFNHQVLESFQQTLVEECWSEEQRNEALAAMVYVACGEAGEALIEVVTNTVQQLTPELFDEIRDLVAELGAEMTSALERSLEYGNLDADRKQALELMIGLSYLRAESYDRSIAQLEPLLDQGDCTLDCYIHWIIAIAHENKENYEQALHYYQQCSEKLQSFILERNRGVCYRSHEKYERSLDCFQKILVIAQQSNDCKAEANIFWNIGNSYQKWGKYEDAIAHYEQSRDRFQKLSDEKQVAWKWDWLSDCYQEWGKFSEALDCCLEYLKIVQRLENQPQIAGAYRSIGRVYKAWGRYEEAIAHYEQSRDLYQQLEKTKEVATRWYNLADCYKEWGKYSEALDCQQKCLEIRQTLEDAVLIAVTYYQLGRIYQAWGKYEDAIAHYEQSRDRYQQLDKEKELANQWDWMASCYRDWGKYEQALECQQHCLEIRQVLDKSSLIAVSDYQLGRIYQAWGKYEEAISYYEQSRDRYQQLENPKEVASRLYNLADCYRDWGKYEQALECQQHCLEIRQTLDELSLIAVSHYQLGRIYQAWGKYEEAIAHYEQSRDRYQNLGLQEEVANKVWWSADCYRKWGKYAEAITFYQQSRNLYKSLGLEETVAKVLSQMSGYYKECEKYEKALEAQQESLDICQKLRDQVTIANAYFQLGHIYQAWGKYEEAIAYYEQSRDLYQQLGREKDVAVQWGWMAFCCRNWGKYKQAVKYDLQKIAILQELDDQPGIADTYSGQGQTYRSWGKYAEAIAHHQRSLNLYQQLDREKNVAQQWGWLASCYRDWGKYEQVIECHHQHLSIHQKNDDQAEIAGSYYWLGYIYQLWGKYAEAIAHYEQSRDLYQQLKKTKEVATRWYNLADCYKDWGKYEQALERQHHCLEILQTLDEPALIAVSDYQLGRIYQDWGKYEEAISYYEQSRDLYQQLEKDKEVASQWYSLADCYSDWGKHSEALACQQRCWEIRQALDDKVLVAATQFRFGRIYQAWGKYEEAIAHYEQSRDLYQQLDKEKNVANLCSRIAACHRERKDYPTAIEFYHHSLERHQSIGNNESVAIRLRQLSSIQRQWAKTCPSDEAAALLHQAESNLQQALHLDTTHAYRKNLAHDQISLALLIAESLRGSAHDTATLQDRIAQFQQHYTDGFARFTTLGQEINRAEQALDIARAYLEIPPLENLDQAETLTRQSLQTFQTFNRRKLEAEAHKLLGEIYLKRASQNPEALPTASQSLSTSLHLYRQLTLTQPAAEVEQLLSQIIL